MMTEECKRAKQIIDSWEHTGAISPTDFAALEEHLSLCAACAARYEALMPFLRRDGSVRAAFDEIGEAENFDNVVMAAVSVSGFRKPAGVYRYIAVAAAAAVLIIGVLVLRFAQPENGSLMEVHFTLAAPEASSVTLVGDFSDWEASRHELADPDGDGVWETRVRLKKGGVYEYNFIIDGEEWIPDPNALMQVDDGFGGESSLLSL